VSNLRQRRHSSLETQRHRRAVCLSGHSDSTLFAARAAIVGCTHSRLMLESPLEMLSDRQSEISRFRKRVLCPARMQHERSTKDSDKTQCLTLNRLPLIRPIRNYHASARQPRRGDGQAVALCPHALRPLLALESWCEIVLFSAWCK
jgi:hypothetical protein